MFIDSTIFVKWMSADKTSLSLEAAISGYILEKVRAGMKAFTTTLVKDEVLIWLSRYRIRELRKFLLSLRALGSLQIVQPTLEDEEIASRNFSKYPLGISDLINISVMRRLDISEIASTDRGFDEISGIKRVFEEFSLEDEFRSFSKRLISLGYKLDYKL
ncbi:MAG: hypothetical protein DRO00_06005 [Thermoproteota archaeon]|nr:MAG: hypothetical protein DRO00_06005 [Candidatus Korarchaeota archaeon]